MKIGIVTCWQPDDNYGTQIQCFALQTYLANKGHDAFLIRYDRYRDMVKEPLTIKKVLKILNPSIVIRKLIKLLKLLISKKTDDRCSPQFRDKYLKQTRIYNNYQELLNDPPIADVYIVGSDQVWNISCTQMNNLNAHFLNFGSENTIRISYAASFGFGRQELTKEYINNVKCLIHKFDGISVREKEGVSICKELEIQNIFQVCDPTFLLTTEDYMSKFKNEDVTFPQKPYVLVYELISKSNLNIKRIKQWAKHRNLEVIYIPGHGKSSKRRNKVFTVPEWVSLINKAEYVITNSFHGTVFSLIFNKKVAVFPLVSFYGTTNGRLEILNSLIQNNILVSKNNTFNKILSSSFDWRVFEKNKEILKQQSEAFLRNFVDI